MKVLLINPPFAVLKGILEPANPLGLPYLAAFLQENSIYCDYINLDQVKLDDYLSLRTHDIYSEMEEINLKNNLKYDNHPAWKSLREKLINYKPGIVGITSTTSSYKSAVKTADIVRKLSPNVKIVFGGPHASAEYKKTIEETNFDFIVRGEGELTLLELVKMIDSDKNRKDFSKILGLSYVIRGRAYHNPSRPVIINLDNLPSPQRFYRLIDTSISYIGIITTRGCNNKCKYCASPFLWSGLRARSVDNVISEIKEGIKLHNTKRIFFHDANFNYSKKRVLDLCQRIIDEKLNIKWGFVGNLNIIDDDICRIMKKSGCLEILAGVETGDQDLMTNLNKKLTIEEIKRSVKILNRNGIGCGAFVMYGLPGQTIESMRATNRLLKEVDFSDIWHSMYFPIPGSKLCSELEKDKVTYWNTTFNSNKSCFEYHNRDPRFKEVIDELHKITKRRRFISGNPLLRLKIFKDYILRKPFLIFEEKIKNAS